MVNVEEEQIENSPPEPTQLEKVYSRQQPNEYTFYNPTSKSNKRMTKSSNSISHTAHEFILTTEDEDF